MNKIPQCIVAMKFLLALVSCLFSGVALSDLPFPESYIEESISGYEEKIIVPVNDLKPGGVREVKYGGFLVYVYRRTDRDLRFLKELSPENILVRDSVFLKKNKRIRVQGTLSNIPNHVIRLSQVQFSEYPFRSIRNDIFVVIGQGPKHGFFVKFLRPDQRDNQLDIFMNVAHGQKYDSAGRQISADGTLLDGGENLFIPPYTYNTDGNIVLGGIVVDRQEAIVLPDYNGLSAQEKLWLACKNNDYATAAEALSQGADPNLKQGRGNALDYAITGSSMEVVRLLLNNGAQPTSISRDMAEIVDRSDILMLLNSFGSD